MKIFEKYLLPRDTNVYRRIEVDITLYEKLEKLSKIYDGSVNKLVNVAIVELIKTEQIDIYQNSRGIIKEPHNFSIRKSSYTALEALKEKYGLSIYKLINIAIYNAVSDE